VSYSRVDAIRIVSTGRELRSAGQRSAADSDRLDESASQMAVCELHGSLFFGSVSGVAETIRERLSRPATPIDVVVVDFARVANIDSSVYTVLSELVDDVSAAGARLIWSQLPDGATAVLARARAGEVDAAPDLDRALEAAEEDLLSMAADDNDDAGDSEDASDRNGDEFADSAGLLEFFETRRTALALCGCARTAPPGTAELVVELYDQVLRSTAARAATIHRSLIQDLR
jgi:MFS superfamily sulfate permease-like transporter